MVSVSSVLPDSGTAEPLPTFVVRALLLEIGEGEGSIVADGVEVNAGFHYKDGQANPVRGFIISGNIFNLFNSIEGMEKNLSEH